MRQWSAPVRSLIRRTVAALCAVGAALAAPSLSAAALPIDRVVVRFTSPEIGGVAVPRFIFERELAFEARLEAMVDESYQSSADEPYSSAHLRAALERHIAETILESLEVSPSPTEADIRRRVNAAQASLSQRVGGAEALARAAALEGLGRREVFRVLQRQARASLYLDRMVAPMLSPSEAELRSLHRAGRTPYSKLNYEQAAILLRRWYVSRALREAVVNYYDGARARLKVKLIHPA